MGQPNDNLTGSCWQQLVRRGMVLKGARALSCHQRGITDFILLFVGHVRGRVGWGRILQEQANVRGPETAHNRNEATTPLVAHWLEARRSGAGPLVGGIDA